MTSSEFVCCGFYIKKNVDFTLISFLYVQNLDEGLSVKLPFELPVQILAQIPVQFLLEVEANSNSFP